MYEELIDRLKERADYKASIRQIKAHRDTHGSTLSAATEAVAAELGIIVDAQVKTAVLVLRAYTKQDLDVAPALLVELDEAVQDAYHGDTECEVEESA